MTTLRTTLRQYFGFDTFRTGQQKAIESLIQGRDTLVVMPTGAGKSLIYQLASLHLDGLTVVVSPLIALMQDQVAALQKRSISAAYINSTLSSRQQQRRLEQVAAGAYELIYVAPERFRSRRFRSILRKIHVGLLAIDEAHCISAWGHDFRPDYRRISRARERMGEPLTVALTATATPAVQDDIADSLGINMQRIVTGCNRPNLMFRVWRRSGIEAKLATVETLLTNLNEQEPASGVLIYAGTRRDSEEVAAFVRDAVGMRAVHYHAGLDAKARQAVQDAFLDGQQPVVAATNAFGMGIDRQDVRLVIHYTMPGSLEAYYQEAGRAGRDGRPAQAILIYDPADRSLHDYFIENGLPSMGALRTLYETISSSESRTFSLTISELSRNTGLHPVMIRVALEQLENAQVVQRAGTDGLALQLRARSWQGDAVRKQLKRLETHAQHRRRQLREIISYAETDGCRRRHILRHFGDHNAVQATLCCDNCSHDKLQINKQETAHCNTIGQEVSLPSDGQELEREVVVWGNAGDTTRVPHLIVALGHERYNVRRLAASALGKLKEVRAVGPLLELLRSEEAPPIRQYAVKALGKIGDRRARSTLLEIAADEREKYYTRDAAKSALKKLKRSHRARRRASRVTSTTSQDTDKRVSEFLNRSHPQRLDGPWYAGWAVDHHSRFNGNQWKRTQTGKLLYQLKYEQKRECALSLGARLAEICKRHAKLKRVDAIVPIPSSVERDFDPVLLLARILGEALNVPVEQALKKTRATELQKNLRTLAEKESNVKGTFTLTHRVSNRRLLLLDDLFDSGATLVEATRTLQQGGAECVYVLAVTKTVHTDA